MSLVARRGVSLACFFVGHVRRWCADRWRWESEQNYKKYPTWQWFLSKKWRGVTKIAIRGSFCRMRGRFCEDEKNGWLCGTALHDYPPKKRENRIFVRKWRTGRKYESFEGARKRIFFWTIGQYSLFETNLSWILLFRNEFFLNFFFLNEFP